MVVSRECIVSYKLILAFTHLLLEKSFFARSISGRGSTLVLQVQYTSNIKRLSRHSHFQVLTGRSMVVHIVRLCTIRILQYSKLLYVLAYSSYYHYRICLLSGVVDISDRKIPIKY